MGTLHTANLFWLPAVLRSATSAFCAGLSHAYRVFPAESAMFSKEIKEYGVLRVQSVKPLVAASFCLDAAHIGVSKEL